MVQSKSIVLCGCTRSIFDITKYLLERGINITYFVSLDEEQAIKYKVSGFHSFKKLSEIYNIPIYYPKEYSLKNLQDEEFFEREKFDLMIVGGWQRLIPEKILKTLRIGGLGVHGSSEMLPKGRGRSTVNWSIIEGKKQFILHIFLMTPEVDDGEIIDHQICDINSWDSCETLYYKFTIMQKRMLEKAISDIFQNNITKHPQKGEPSFYPKRTPEDGKIDWNKRTDEIYDLIRGITKPYPGAFSYVDTNKIIIWKAHPFDSKIKYNDAKIGQIVEKFSSGDFVINSKNGTILVIDYEGTVKIGDLLK